MNPMNSESLVLQVHQPPGKYQKWASRPHAVFTPGGPNLQTRGSLDVYKVYQLQSGELS